MYLFDCGLIQTDLSILEAAGNKNFPCSMLVGAYYIKSTILFTSMWFLPPRLSRLVSFSTENLETVLNDPIVNSLLILHFFFPGGFCRKKIGKL